MARFLTLIGAILAISSVGSALYSRKDAVVELTPDNFDHRVKDGKGVWIVEFYAPWCGHCKNLAPEYKKAGKALEGIVGVGAVDCDVHKSLCGQYGVRGFPTIKVSFVTSLKYQSIFSKTCPNIFEINNDQSMII